MPWHASFSDEESCLGYSMRTLPRAAILFLAAACLAALPAVAHAGYGPDIKVLVGENLSQVILKGHRLTVEKFSNGRWSIIVKRLSRASISSRAGLGVLDGTAVREPMLKVQPKSGMITVNGRQYNGRVIVYSLGNGLALVNELPLEKYLAGVVNGEISSKWPLEAVKAQVIAARTYALYRMERSDEFFDLRSDTSDQVYLGAAAVDPRALKAVRDTRGQVLKYGDELIPAFFHSNCGGRTADSADVWGLPHPSLKSTECSFCDDAPYSHWKLTMSASELQRIFNNLYPKAGSLRSVSVRKRSKDGRVTILTFKTSVKKLLVDSGDLRREIGYSRLPSTLFHLSGSGRNIVFEGRGFGHGVGLCQWGAKGAADRGWDHKRILGKYYRGAVIRKIY